MRRVPAQVMFGVLLVLLPMLAGFILLALRSALAFLVLLLSRRFLLGLLACFLILILGLVLLFHDSTPWIYWVIPVVSPYTSVKSSQDPGGLTFKLSSEMFIY